VWKPKQCDGTLTIAEIKTLEEGRDLRLHTCAACGKRNLYLVKDPEGEGVTGRTSNTSRSSRSRRPAGDDNALFGGTEASDRGDAFEADHVIMVEVAS
jgi:hypothetical protein